MGIPVIFVSAPSLRAAGGLSIVRSLLISLDTLVEPQYLTEYAFVHPAIGINLKNIHCIHCSWPSKGWLQRIFFEYIYCFFVSLKYRPTIWLSLHDTSPFVLSRHQIVYCHNPSPMFRPTLKQAIESPGLAIFSRLYSFFYHINIHANDMVVVQQYWLKQYFRRFIPSEKLFVATPSVYKPPYRLKTDAISSFSFSVKLLHLSIEIERFLIKHIFLLFYYLIWFFNT